MLLNVAWDVLALRLRATACYAHCAVALVCLCEFSFFPTFRHTRGMTSWCGGQPCWEVEKWPRGMIPLEAFQAGALYPVALPCWTSLAQVAKESLARGTGVWSILNYDGTLECLCLFLFPYFLSFYFFFFLLFSPWLENLLNVSYIGRHDGKHDSKAGEEFKVHFKVLHGSDIFIYVC